MGPKIKILHFITTTNIGGTERMLINLHQLLNKNRFDSMVVSLLPEKGYLLSELRKSGIKVKSLDYKGYNLPVVIYRFLKFIKKNEVEIIQTYGLRPALLSRIFVKKPGPKIISSIRGIEEHRTRLMIKLDQMTADKVDRFISNSYAGKEAFVKREGFPKEKIAVIHNGIDIARYQTTIVDKKQQIFTFPNKFNVIVLANLWPYKGHYDVVDSLECLGQFKNKVHFYFIGKDCENGKLQRYVEKKNARSFITFMGYQHDVIPYLKQANAMLLPSYHEGLPTSILEAMLCGTLVIATDVGGVPELITDRKSGILIKPGATDQIGGSILWAMNNPDICKQYTIAARTKAENGFRLETMVREYEQIYEEMVDD